MQLETISHYKILKRLGAGGMGEVYLAEDSHLQRKVAIKLLSQESVADDQARKRLLREARAAAKLDHPNICTVHEVGEENGNAFIVMQYVEGETLADRIRRTRSSLPEVFDLAIQIADALAEAHSHAIIHRDIKPQNIMVTPRGQVKVLDFGLAKRIHREQVSEDEANTESDLTSPGVISGTVPYMSPEQAQGEVLDTRSDIFSFGTLLYEIITGRHPFKSDTVYATIAAILLQEPPPLNQFKAEVSVELQGIVNKALRKKREERYQTIESLLADLKGLKLGHNLVKAAEQPTQLIWDGGKPRPSGRLLRKKVCMLGSNAVGKTSLVKRFVKGTFSETYLTTVGVKIDQKAVRIGEREIRISLWDIEGQDVFQALRVSYLAGAAGFILVVDGMRRRTLEEALDILKSLQQNFDSIPFVIVFNKADLSNQWEIHDSEIAALSTQGIAVLKGSAKTGMGVEETFIKLASMMHEH